MVDAIVSFTLKKLDVFLTQEATFLLRVKDDVEWVRRELTWMQSFLKDAEQKQVTNQRIRSWIADIRSIAYKTEDVIDAFYTEVKGKEPSNRTLLTTSLRKFFCIAGETNVYDIGKEIKALKERLSDISRKREVYGISNIDDNAQETTYVTSQDRLRDLRRTSSLADEEHFVGFDDDLNLLDRRLFSSNELRRGVVSIWGMGGLGKTSLARKLYNTNKCEFELHAWVCVSQEWNIEDLLQIIIKSLIELTYEERKVLEKMNVDERMRYLHKILKDKRYLVVIDDIWDEEAWECLRSALPDNQNGSRVIITTRKETVAELSDERTYVHKLRHLRDDESWELFCKKAFSKRSSACPQDLVKVGKEMVEKCDGLPLAIIVLGGLLSRKHSNEWHVIRKRVWKALIDKSIHISTLLDLSYNDLSRELKSCFLYLGIFPEDHEIRGEKLIQLWVAEDLIPQSEGLDSEDLAESYLRELNARSLIQVTRKHYKMYSTCRIHDLLRDLAVNKAKEQDFFHIYEESVNPTIKPFSTRRIAFRSGFERYVAAIDDHFHPQVHTLSFLNCQSLLDDNDVTKLLTLINKRFKSLRVVDLEGVKIRSKESKLKLFEAMEKLVHLRYLGLHETDLDDLPESMGNLQALQTMDVWNESGRRIQLPRDMYKLKQLRHLIGPFETKEGEPTALEDLTNVQCLDRIDISGWLRNEESDEFALKAFSKLCNLRTLAVVFFTSTHRLSIEPLLSCKNLITLKLGGRIKSLPMEMHESLPNLTKLFLLGAEFVEDPLPALEKLPNLLYLKLERFRVKSLIITAGGFYKLVSLSISNFPDDFPEDMKVQIEEGALPSLRFINPYLKIFSLPERLRDLQWH